MAVEPRLLNPTKIEIERIDQVQTRFDHFRRQAQNFVARKTKVSLQAQVVWVTSTTASRPMMTKTGVDDQRTGYAILRVRDVRAAGIELQRSDKIVLIEEENLEVYVTLIEKAAHYGGEYKLLKVHFTDRKGNDG